MRSSVRLFPLILAAAICGCAQMGGEHGLLGNHPTSVTLEIQTTPADGFVTTYGSNQKTYYYRYSDGDDTHGNVNVKYNEGNDVKIHIELKHATSTFAIDDVIFTDNANNQLTKIDASGNHAHISDKNKNGVYLNAYFEVKVVDNTAGGSVYIYCDPRIVNN